MRSFILAAVLLMTISGCVSRKRFNALLRSKQGSTEYVESVRKVGVSIPGDSAWFYARPLCPDGSMPVMSALEKREGSRSRITVKTDSSGLLAVRCDCLEWKDSVAVIDTRMKAVVSLNADVMTENESLRSEIKKLEDRTLFDFLGIPRLLRSFVVFAVLVAASLLLYVFLSNKIRPGRGRV